MIGMGLLGMSGALKNLFSGRNKAERQAEREERRAKKKIEKESKLIEKAELQKKLDDIREGKITTEEAAKNGSGKGIFANIIPFVMKYKWFVLGAVVILVAAWYFMKPKRRSASPARRSQLARARAAKRAKARR